MAIPIRSFSQGKLRLSLPTKTRADLIRSLATALVQATAFPILVVSSDPEVRSWAEPFADLIDDPGTLNGAAESAVSWARHSAWKRCVIAHADLAFPGGIDQLITAPLAHEVWAVQSHRDHGTPVISIPTHTEFTFSYGVDSFLRHEVEAKRRGLAFHALIDTDLGIDIDTQADLEFLDAHTD